MTNPDPLTTIHSQHPDAFDTFVDQWGRRLMAFGLRMCGQREDAEDVFQETLVEAYRGLSKLRDPGALKTWLFRVVSSRCLMKRRKEPPRREVSLEELGPPGLDAGVPEAMVDWSRRAEVEVERGEVRAALNAALATVAPEHRIVLLLRDVEGLSTKETAEVLGIGESAVKMRLHRARMQVRQALGERFGEVA